MCVCVCECVRVCVCVCEGGGGVVSYPTNPPGGGGSSNMAGATGHRSTNSPFRFGRGYVSEATWGGPLNGIAEGDARHPQSLRDWLPSNAVLWKAERLLVKRK